MSEAVRTTRAQHLKIAGVIAIASAGILNVVFWLLSGMYIENKPQLALDISRVRIAFGTLTFSLAIASYGAALAPRFVGHGLARITGIAALVGGIKGLRSALPTTLGVTLLVLGLLVSVLSQYSLRYSRSAWAFLIGILSVMATITFFGAPKIRHVLGIGLWEALLIPGLLIVAVVALSMLGAGYRQSNDAQKSHASDL